MVAVCGQHRVHILPRWRNLLVFFPTKLQGGPALVNSIKIMMATMDYAALGTETGRVCGDGSNMAIRQNVSSFLLLL